MKEQQKTRPQHAQNDRRIVLNQGILLKILEDNTEMQDFNDDVVQMERSAKMDAKAHEAPGNSDDNEE